MNQENKDFGCKKVGSRFSCVATGTKRFSLALPRDAKKNVFFFFFWGSRSTPVFLYTYLQFLSNLAHLNHKPDITMVYSLHGCVQIFIFLAGGGVCQIGRYLQYIYLLFFALDIIVCFFLEREFVYFLFVS